MDEPIGFYRALAEQIIKSNPNHDPKTGQFSAGPANRVHGEFYHGSGFAGLAGDASNWKARTPLYLTTDQNYAKKYTGSSAFFGLEQPAMEARHKAPTIYHVGVKNLNVFDARLPAHRAWYEQHRQEFNATPEADDFALPPLKVNDRHGLPAGEAVGWMRHSLARAGYEGAFGYEHDGSVSLAVFHPAGRVAVKRHAAVAKAADAGITDEGTALYYDVFEPVLVGFDEALAKYNQNHDKRTGQFASSKGGSAAPAATSGTFKPARIPANKKGDWRGEIAPGVTLRLVTDDDRTVKAMTETFKQRNNGLDPVVAARRLGTAVLSADIPRVTVKISSYAPDKTIYFAVHGYGRDTSDPNPVLSAHREWEMGSAAGGREVHHASFFIDNKLQGRGTAKKFLSESVGLYQEAGVKRVFVEAVEVGGYAWAKFGFRPTLGSWNDLQEKLRDRLAPGTHSSSITPAEATMLRRIAGSTDPRAIWKLSDHLKGKQALVHRSWEGFLDLGDADAMKRFHEYIFAKPSRRSRTKKSALTKLAGTGQPVKSSSTSTDPTMPLLFSDILKSPTPADVHTPSAMGGKRGKKKSMKSHQCSGADCAYCASGGQMLTKSFDEVLKGHKETLNAGLADLSARANTMGETAHASSTSAAHEEAESMHRRAAYAHEEFGSDKQALHHRRQAEKHSKLGRQLRMVAKGNPNHDALGRFAAGKSGAIRTDMDGLAALAAARKGAIPSVAASMNDMHTSAVSATKNARREGGTAEHHRHAADKHRAAFEHFREGISPGSKAAVFVARRQLMSFHGKMMVQHSTAAVKALEAGRTTNSPFAKPVKKAGEEAFSASIPFRIVKLDEEKRMVYGFASVSAMDGVELEDVQNDVVDMATLTKAAHDFIRHSRTGGEMHQTIGTGEIVESLMIDSDVKKELGITRPEEGWFIGYHVTSDAVWGDVKAGKYASFSIGGTGQRVPVTDTTDSE